MAARSQEEKWQRVRMRSSGGGAQVLGVEELGVEEGQRRGGVAWMLAAQMRQRGRDDSMLDWARL